MTAPVSLLDVVNRAIEADKVPLPVFSAAASRIQQELAKKEPDIRIIEKVITADQALSSQVLKIANSAFYRGLTEVSTVRAAIMRLGMKEVENIVLLATSQRHFKSNDKMLRQVMKKLWQHSVGCAYGAVWLSKRYAYGIDQGQAFFAGLFHDVGKLFILMVIEQVKGTNKDVKITDALLWRPWTGSTRGKAPNCSFSGTCPSISVLLPVTTTQTKSMARTCPAPGGAYGQPGLSQTRHRSGAE
jgi:hypothetical protein